MNKQRWVYIGEGGSRSTIGIIHNTSKGQFMIYCNKKIVQVEFKLYESKEFSFFLDEELCKIFVIKEGNAYRYEFSLDMKTETPLNLERKRIERSNVKKSFIGIAVALLVVSMIIGGGVLLHKRSLKKKREKNGVFAVATMSIYSQPKSFSLIYSFPTQYSQHVHQVEYYRNPNPMSPNGFPFYDGDEFYVQYSRFDASNHQIFYDRPTEKQVNEYKNRTKEAHLSIHPDQNDEYCICVLEAAYEIKGLTGLLYFYHQEKSPTRNRRFNIKKYKEFILTEEFKEKTEKCNRLVE